VSISSGSTTAQSPSLSQVVCDKDLLDLPKDIWSLFSPDTVDELDQLAIRILKLKKREAERDKVMYLQRFFNRPLNPNMSHEKCLVYCRIEKLRQRLKKDQYQDSQPDTPEQ